MNFYDGSREYTDREVRLAMRLACEAGETWDMLDGYCQQFFLAEARRELLVNTTIGSCLLN
jgi:hypothetical protein